MYRKRLTQISQPIFYIGHTLYNNVIRVSDEGGSSRRGSNPRPWAWEAHALPTELLPHGFVMQSYCFFWNFRQFFIFFRKKSFWNCCNYKLFSYLCIVIITNTNLLLWQIRHQLEKHWFNTAFHPPVPGWPYWIICACILHILPQTRFSMIWRVVFLHSRLQLYTTH